MKYYYCLVLGYFILGPLWAQQKTSLPGLVTDKKTNDPYILMVEGSHLVHPKLEAGKRSRMKIFRVNPNEDLPLRTIENILQKSLDLYRKGIVNLKV